MRKGLFLMFVVLLFLLSACSKTSIVEIKDSLVGGGEDSSAADSEVDVTAAVKCVDTDGDDLFTSGKVTVTYGDKSTKEFIDECPVPNEQFITEYICNGNDVKTKNAICDKFCVAGVCFE